MKLRIRSSGRARCCPYCHDRLGPGIHRACTLCQAVYHVDCARRCLSLGCSGTLGPVSLDSPWASERLRRIVIVVAMLICLSPVFILTIGATALTSLPATVGILLVGIIVLAGIIQNRTASSSSQSQPRPENEPLAKLQPLGFEDEEKPPFPRAEDTREAPPPNDDAALARIRQYETLRRRRQSPGLGKTI